ncbi:hypothetical protein Enr13x_13920 [Stieleria neptunia]|uniref:DUF1499 domain-containing protein n=2 Tax=Stieleria neptunia TaxID=2527979 RepID=A0A518HL94_9BACT|nr:hypothetical protein Enr13x_13920 [Stieleria neptunia]
MIGWITLGVALAITLAIIVSVVMRVDDWGRDWTQNRARLDPAATRPGLRPVQLDGTVQDAAERIRQWTETNSKWDWVSEDQAGDDRLTIKLTRTTPLMRFVDDIDVELTANPDGQAPTRPGVIVNATSQSRVGKGDLGQNPRNLIELTTALRNR